MPVSLRPVNPDKVVSIVVHDLPMYMEPEEGDYELKFGNRPKNPEYHDIITITKRLEGLMPNRVDDILMKLQNFKKVYLNLETGEIL